jgi:hypothetical protein
MTSISESRDLMDQDRKLTIIEWVSYCLSTLIIAITGIIAWQRLAVGAVLSSILTSTISFYTRDVRMQYHTTFMVTIFIIDSPTARHPSMIVGVGDYSISTLPKYRIPLVDRYNVNIFCIEYTVLV